MVREPDKKSALAEAWQIKMEQENIDAHIKDWGHAPAGIRQYFVRSYHFHPFWHWWMIGVVDLKDHEGMPPANKQYEEAEYEFTIWSLGGEVDIDACDRADLVNRGFQILQPPDVTFHFHGVTDEQAGLICEAAVSAIISGQSPDSDFRDWWKESLASTVTHFTLGVH